MSLASSPDCQIRAEDKALKLLFPTIEDPLTNSFDDYINQALYDLSDDDKEDFFIGDVGDLFDSEALSSGGSSQSPIGASARHKESSPQPWRKGLWCLNQNESSVRYPDGSHNQLKVPSQPLNRADLQDPTSPSLTPSQKGTKRSVTSPKAATIRKNPYARQTYSREVTLSPSPMYARLPNGKMPHHETWQQDFQNFHLQVQDDVLPLSPPPSGRPVQQGNATRMNAINVVHNGTHMQTLDLTMPSYDMSQPIPSIEQLDPELYAPRPNPTFMPSGSTVLSSPTDQSNLASHYASPLQGQKIPAWHTEPVGTGHKSAYLYNSQSQMMEGRQTQAWWSPPPTTSDHSATSSFEQAHDEYYPRIAAPSPQRPVHQLISSSSHDLQLGGLMIQYPSSDSHAPKSDTHQPSQPLSAAAPPFSPTSAYPPLPSLKGDSYHEAFSPTSPFTTPRRRHQTSPDRSASISPTNTTRSTRQTSPTRSTRRKSMGNPKASGVSKTPRTPRTPKTPNAGFEMNFVNLTAADSAKLLSDVAPSGSSKTRARREQEARERRRRLSEAAVKLVRKAGGDVKALEKVIQT
ncbi:hypothetical protein GJ744_000240 [Endocarpon pusillum]|uniref:Developmental regulatory protein wetA n=1 Tax=Endocarpon pusillum TaxID=364733 RepID=A0A8H7AP63_9EURO|nr:hypothetical protein GJ744_000240 [Endocarpon pusillum]